MALCGLDFFLLIKFEIRIPPDLNKIGRNKSEILMTEIPKEATFGFLISRPFRKFMTLKILNFVIISCFEFRTSDFRFNRHPVLSELL